MRKPCPSAGVLQDQARCRGPYGPARGDRAVVLSVGLGDYGAGRWQDARQHSPVAGGCVPCRRDPRRRSACSAATPAGVSGRGRLPFASEFVIRYRYFHVLIRQAHSPLWQAYRPYCPCCGEVLREACLMPKKEPMACSPGEGGGGPGQPRKGNRGGRAPLPQPTPDLTPTGRSPPPRRRGHPQQPHGAGELAPTARASAERTRAGAHQGARI